MQNQNQRSIYLKEEPFHCEKFQCPVLAFRQICRTFLCPFKISQAGTAKLLNIESLIHVVILQKYLNHPLEAWYRIKHGNRYYKRAWHSWQILFLSKLPDEDLV